MNRKASNVDGFVRRVKKGPRRTLDDVENVKATDGLRPVDANQTMDTFADKPRRFLKKQRTRDDVDADIMESLADLPGYGDLSDSDFTEPGKVNKKALKKAKKTSKKGKKGKKPLKIILIILGVLVLLAAAAFVALKYLWPEDTLDGNFWEVFQQEKLQEDANGRSNILIFGTEEEDYDGADLTDSVMLLSVNQTDHSAYMVSLPRDLWVKHTCPIIGTTAGKLNETYYCSLDTAKTNEDVAAGALRDKVGEVLGLDVQYYVHINWAGFTQIIDSVGGVDVTIESDDPRGIYDINTGLKLANGDVHLDGTKALDLARARGAFGGYGLESSNFAREANQQRIIKALQAKITSGGAISDPAQALSLIGALGDNLQTNFKANEVRVLMDVAKAASSGNAVSLPLLDAEKNIRLVTTDMISGASVVVPTAGTFVYTAIHDYIRQEMSSDPIVREAAVIDVLNGTDTPGVAQKKADELKDKGYKIGVVGNAPNSNYGAVEVYQVNTAKSGTAKALAELFEVELKNVIPAGFDTKNVDFIVVVGAVTE